MGSFEEWVEARPGGAADLLARCQRGEGGAWEEVLAQVRQLAFDLARCRYRLGEDSEDVAQTVQVLILRRLSQVRNPGVFAAWVRRIIHRAALDCLRSRRPVTSLEALPPFWEDLATRLPDPCEAALLKVDVHRAIARLSPLYQEPIVLYVLEGLSQEEVGERLGRPRGTVACQIQRGLLRLQRSLLAAEAEARLRPITPVPSHPLPARSPSGLPPGVATR